MSIFNKFNDATCRMVGNNRAYRKINIEIVPRFALATAILPRITIPCNEFLFGFVTCKNIDIADCANIYIPTSTAVSTSSTAVFVFLSNFYTISTLFLYTRRIDEFKKSSFCFWCYCLKKVCHAVIHSCISHILCTCIIEMLFRKLF